MENQEKRQYIRSVIFAFAAVAIATPSWSAGLMPPAQQTALVQKYCAVCHTDAVKNGGLSLQHYDAAALNPPLAAMLLSKLKGGAMGAAGIGMPDEATRDAWMAAATAQAEHAKEWHVSRTESPGSKESVVVASIVRDVATRAGTPLYRLILACDTSSRQGEMQLAWSPQPQTDRTFSVSADGRPAIPHKLSGREQKMGNGSAGATDLAAATLNVPLAEKTLTVTDLFPGETVVFPIGDLDERARQQLGACFPASARK
jgi:hypothetical protein